MGLLFCLAGELLPIDLYKVLLYYFSKEERTSTLKFTGLKRRYESLRIEYSKKAVKYINAMDKQTKQRLREAIEKIPLGDIKRLQGTEDGYRLRVGTLRVLFTMENDVVYIDNIMPRGQAYKRL